MTTTDKTTDNLIVLHISEWDGSDRHDARVEVWHWLGMTETDVGYGASEPVLVAIPDGWHSDGEDMVDAHGHLISLSVCDNGDIRAGQGERKHPRQPKIIADGRWTPDGSHVAALKRIAEAGYDGEAEEAKNAVYGVAHPMPSTGDTD